VIQCSAIPLQKLHRILHTSASDDSPAILEVLKEEGRRVVMQVDDWSEWDCAV